MSATDSEDSGAGGLSPINLIDCGLEDLVTALLHGQPIAMPEGGPPFDLENDTARCIFAYYARRCDLWPRAKAVQTHEIEDSAPVHPRSRFAGLTHARHCAPNAHPPPGATEPGGSERGHTEKVVQPPNRRLTLPPSPRTVLL